MSDLSKMGRHELEAELHKWRTGHQLGAMQEDLNAMQARAVEAEAKLARASAAAEKWYQPSEHSDPQDARSDCADEILTALGVRPIGFSREAVAAVAELKRRNGEP